MERLNNTSREKVKRDHASLTNSKQNNLNHAIRRNQRKHIIIIYPTRQDFFSEYGVADLAHATCHHISPLANLAYLAPRAIFHGCHQFSYPCTHYLPAFMLLVGLKSLLSQGLSEPDFYGDLVYKLKKIVGSNNFTAQFIIIISHYKKIGYNINVLQQTACLVVNPITVGNFAFLFNCTPVGRTSDSMMVPT